MDPNFKIVQIHQNETRVDPTHAQYITFLLLHIQRSQQIDVYIKRFRLKTHTLTPL